ncbi:MAG: diacylglycerol kinase [Porticoccaceae bacterium]|nr:diacylglycerol kinase [Porticoccaceae bacterium]
MTTNEPIPLLINPGSGSAARVRAELAEDPRVEVRCLEAKNLGRALRQSAKEGCERVIVCGGDGTLALAATHLAGTDTALAVIPGGTLNHFAARHQIPSDPAAALTLALTGAPRSVPVGYVNDRLFINTSSVGAYVTFVRTREYLEQRMSYHLASVLAGLRRLLRMRNARVILGNEQVRTPLVFVGVDERDLQFPVLGDRKATGRAGLHVIAIRSEGPWETVKLAFNAMIRGIDPLTKSHHLESFITDNLALAYRRRRSRIIVALDGELVRVRAPLHYRYINDGMRVVLPVIPE